MRPRSTTSHCGVVVQWNWLAKPAGLRRHCEPPLGASAVSREAGEPSASGSTRSRQRARPSASVKSSGSVIVAVSCMAAGRGWGLDRRAL